MPWEFNWVTGGVQKVEPDLLYRWSAAFEQHGNIWQCPEIVRCWEETIAKARGFQPNLLVAKDCDAHELIYPLYVRRKTVWGADTVLIEPLGGESQFDYQDPLEIGNAMLPGHFTFFWRELERALQKRFGRHYEFVAYRLSKEVGIPSMTQNAFADAPFIDLKSTSSLDEYLVRRGKKLRENVRRGLRHIGSLKCHALTVIANEEIPQRMQQFCDNYKQQWGREGRAHALQQAEIGACWTRLAETAAKLGKLHLSALIVGDEVWSWHLGFEHRGVLLWYKPTYNLQYEKYSPGMLHLALAVHDCIGRGVQTLDLGWGEERYKYRWTDQKVILHSVRLDRGVCKISNDLQRAARMARQSLKRLMLRSNPQSLAVA